MVRTFSLVEEPPIRGAEDFDFENEVWGMAQPQYLQNLLKPEG